MTSDEIKAELQRKQADAFATVTSYTRAGVGSDTIVNMIEMEAERLISGFKEKKVVATIIGSSEERIQNMTDYNRELDHAHLCVNCGDTLIHTVEDKRTCDEFISDITSDCHIFDEVGG